jgi:hypothetical protein
MEHHFLGNGYTGLQFTYHIPQALQVSNSIIFNIFTELWNHCQNLMLELFHHLKKGTQCQLAVTLSFPHGPKQSLIYFLSLWFTIFWIFHKMESCSVHMAFCDCLSSLRINYQEHQCFTRYQCFATCVI